MAVPTFTPQIKSASSPKWIIYVLGVVGIGLFIYFGGGLITNFSGLGGKAALSVEVLEGSAEVYIDGEYLGAVPYYSEEIKPGSRTVSVKGEENTYDIDLDFLSGSQVVLNRDLGVSDVFSSGQDFWLEKGRSETVLSVISDPAGASVYVDNTQIGTTPFSTSNLVEGEYDLRLEHPGFETQVARIKIQKAFKLNVSSKLFALAVPSVVSVLEDASNIYNVYSDNAFVTSNTSSWVQAVIYWNGTRGINLEGAGMNKDLVFDYFLDSSGRLFNASGRLIDASASSEDVDLTGKIAYLNEMGSVGISDIAKRTLDSFGGVVGGTKVTIMATGMGWLNVRSSPGLGGAVLTTVNVGESYTLLEEGNGWVKIKASDTVEGWVSSTYASF